MSGKRAVQAVFAFVLVFTLLTNSASAVFSPSEVTQNSTRSESSQENLLQVGTLGKSGTTFRHVGTIGLTDSPYVDDTLHINRPYGLYIQPGSNEMLVTEEQGFRVLKYNLNKTHLLTLGHSGLAGTDDGYLQRPTDAVVAPNGHIWVADWTRVVAYNTTGETIQEFPEEESWRGGSEHGRFDGAVGIVFDQSGNMFIADQYNHRVEIFTWSPDGVPVYKATIGTGVPGSGLNELNRPYRVRVKPDGELYILDFGNNRVLKCPHNTSTDTWSCGLYLSGLNEPQGLYIDGNGVVYVSDTANGLIRKCTGTTCSSFPVDVWSYGVAADSQGNIYSAYAWGCVVYKYNSSGAFIETLLGVQDTCYLTDDQHFFVPRVEIDPQGNMLILEENGSRLMKYAPNGTLLWTFGEPGRDIWDNAHLTWPHGLDTDKEGNIYIANQWRVMVISPTGEYLRSYGPEVYEDPGRIISWATDVAVNDTTGSVYVVDNPNHRVVIYTKEGTVSGYINASATCQATNLGLCGPVGIEVDVAGNVYIGDWGNSRVQKFNNLHQLVMTIGITGQSGDAHNLISGPDDIEVDAKGNIYVADMNLGRVQVFDPSGAYLATIGGQWGNGKAEFKQLSDVSIAPDGKIYISDIANMRIEVFQPGYLGWVQKNINGFGERYQHQATALEVFNGELYASTCFWGTGSQVWKTSNGTDWVIVADSGVINGPDDGCITNLVVHNNNLYASSGWGGNPATLWRYNGSTWGKVLGEEAIAFYGMETFGGKIYVCSHQQTFDGPGLSIFSSATGNLNDWTEMAVGGNGNPNNYVCSLGIFQDRLYAFTENEVEGLEVWRLNTAQTGWEVLATDGLGDVTNFSSGGSAVFNNTLYMGSWSRENGGIIQKSTNGTTWTTVMTGGFGDPTNEKVEGLVVVDGALYAILNNSQEGIEVWRTEDGTTWYPFSTNGFGDPENTGTLGNNAVTFFKNSLYLGISNNAKGGQVLQLLHKKFYLPFTNR